MPLSTWRNVVSGSAPERLSFGIGSLLVFSLLSAGNEVFVANRLQSIDYVTLLLLVFLPTSVLFVMLQLHRWRAFLRQLVADRRDVLLVNLLTAVSWFGFFLGLRYVEPAIVAAIVVGIGPVVMLLVARVLRPASVIRATDLIAAVGIIVALGLLTEGAVSGRTAVHQAPAPLEALGVGAALVSGISTAVAILYTKRLYDRSWSPDAVMAVRFWALVLATAAAVLIIRPTVVWSTVTWVSIAIIVSAGTIAPLYLFQLGVKHVEPVAVAIIAGAAPVFTVALQLLDPRLHWSALSIVGVTVTAACITLMVVAAHRGPQHGARAPADDASTLGAP